MTPACAEASACFDSSKMSTFQQLSEEMAVKIKLKKDLSITAGDQPDYGSANRD